MYIDHLAEYQLLQTLLHKLPKVDPLKTVVLNVSPDYSSTVAMQIAHYLSDKGHMLDIITVDVPYPGESKDLYVEAFKETSLKLINEYNQVILCEAAVLSGKNYTWLKDILVTRGYSDNNIISVALLEMYSSTFKSTFVGEYIKDMPEFYWERYNKAWDSNIIALGLNSTDT
jgi:ABC-type uncharacterized transport system YnjBCD permease subunit